jgi:hypothetical protein
MSGNKCNISLMIVLVSLLSSEVFSQQIIYRDSIAGNNVQKVNLKPKLSYSVGSTFLIVPHLGSVAGITVSPFLSIPLSPRLSVDGGIIAGHFYSGLGNSNSESALNGTFNELSVYGSASYHINSQLTVYGAGIKQLTTTSPFNFLPKSSFTFGSSYNFGNFSIGVSMQMSKWNGVLSPFPLNGSQGFNSPYDLRPGTLNIFGR